MAISSYFKKQNKASTAVIFDIGSGHIGASLVLMSPKEVPQIVYSIRTPMVFQKHIDFDRFLGGMLKTLQEIGSNLQKNGIPILRTVGFKSKKIDSVMCVFSSPWYISQTRIIKFEKKKPFLVSEKFIQDIVTRSEKQFEKSSTLQKVRKKLKESVVIEEHIIQTVLNGYHTSNPYEKLAKTVEVSIFLSMISKEVKTKTQEVLEKIFHVHGISFHSFALASFSAIRDIFHSEEDFLLVDVGGEVTDISLIRKGILLETVSFPTGKNFLIRSIVLDLNVLPEEAHSLVRMSINNKENDELKKFNKALADAEKVWLKSMQHALSEVGDSQLLPRTIFLTADPDLGQWFKKILQKDDLKSRTFTNEPFTVIAVGEQELYKHCNILKGVAPDPFLTLETLFIEKLMHS